MGQACTIHQQLEAHQEATQISKSDLDRTGKGLYSLDLHLIAEQGLVIPML